SRRRHTRFDCDWSSDVCSSDLISKSRKVTATRKKKKPNPHPFYMDKEIVRLKPKKFNTLRENADFIALVRIGRALNALAYSDQRSEERRVGKECRLRWWKKD